MARKKLTKAQVKSRLRTIHNSLYRLIIENLDVPDNNVPMSTPKLMELHRTIGSAFNRVK